MKNLANIMHLYSIAAILHSLKFIFFLLNYSFFISFLIDNLILLSFFNSISLLF